MIDWQAVGAIGGLCGGSGVVIGIFATMIRAGFKLFSRLDQQDAQLADIKNEMFPNHGGSMRDAVDKSITLSLSNQKELKRLHQRVTRIERDQKKAGTR